MLFFLIFLLGGYLASLAAGVSYFGSSRFGKKTRIALGCACLLPLVSLTLLFKGLAASGSQWLAVSPCIGAALAFLPILSFGSPAAFVKSPLRGIAGLFSIGWSGASAFICSDYCFMGACC
jgi:hypothetical protein